MGRFIAIFLFLFFLFPTSVQAAANLDYTGFESHINIQKDMSLLITESITVNYKAPLHGIFRDIPERRLNVLSIADENGTPYKYKISGGNVKNIRIGDPDVTVVGEHVYVIQYEVKRAIKEYPDHFELYWNITGSNWDSILPKPTATISSDFADITKVDCFAGTVGTSIRSCKYEFDEKSASFTSSVDTGVGSDFTVVVGLSSQNQFVFPSTLEQFFDFIYQYWGYFLTIIPLATMVIIWFKKGRDERYVSENIYYTPQVKSTRRVGIFERKHIPFVYSPIKGLTPAEIGTLIDEKVDIHDVVAEITELARLGYLKMKKIDKKWIFGKNDYEFSKQKKDTDTLFAFQKDILDSLFASEDIMLLSSLKYKFYKSLANIKKDLYGRMEKENYFFGNPDTVRTKWVFFVAVMCGLIFAALSIYSNVTGQILVFVVGGVLGVVAFLFAIKMPRRTPKGYALYRQIEGLRWYINKGAWRQEIAEKRLFLDEILPLAISLGVVKKLASDMKDLGFKPPEYMGNMATNSFASDMSNFEASASTALVSSPSSSGGSGFSGGSSGGGGGGGGGGGW